MVYQTGGGESGLASINPDSQTLADKVSIEAARDAVRLLLTIIGEDPDREGLQDTPRRVVSALIEMTAGYQDDPVGIASTTFKEKCDEIIVLRDISFTSLCEHHLLPFTGVAHIGYLPFQCVVGISKLARLVECLSQRLQLQERLTTQIAEALYRPPLDPLGVGVVVKAQHACMSCRGVKQKETEMVTSAMYGVFREKPEARAEFLSMIR